jgi:hypothetical protein
MVGEIISEWWATSNRNGGRDHSGMVGDIERNQHIGVRMPDILILCPVRAEPVQTGLDTETVVFDTLPSLLIPLLCPLCGQTHVGSQRTLG